MGLFNRGGLETTRKNNTDGLGRVWNYLVTGNVRTPTKMMFQSSNDSNSSLIDFSHRSPGPILGGTTRTQKARAETESTSTFQEIRYCPFLWKMDARFLTLKTHMFDPRQPNVTNWKKIAAWTLPGPWCLKTPPRPTNPTAHTTPTHLYIGQIAPRPHICPIGSLGVAGCDSESDEHVHIPDHAIPKLVFAVNHSRELLIIKSYLS